MMKVTAVQQSIGKQKRVPLFYSIINRMCKKTSEISILFRMEMIADHFGD